MISAVSRLSAPFLAVQALWLVMAVLTRVVPVGADVGPANAPVVSSPLVGTLDTLVFEQPASVDLEQPWATLFGGLLRDLQLADLGAFALVMLLLQAGAFAWATLAPGSRVPRAVALLGSCVTSVVLSLHFSEGWDELYLNLRHSWSMVHAGQYSFSPQALIEGTVDFLPFVLVGLLGRLGAPLEESLITLTLAGNVVVVLAGYAMARRVLKSTATPLVAAWVLATYPCVLAVGATGFTATLFSGLILWALYALFFRSPDWERRGFVLLGLLTLVRIEGVLLAGLLWGLVRVVGPWRAWTFPEQRRALLRHAAIDLSFVLGPFLLATLVRWIVFGYPIPLPVLFKFSGTMLLGVGLRQLASLADWFLVGPLLVATALPLHLTAKGAFKSLRLHQPLLALTLFCFTYFTSGGDWFPLTWARYAMPFLLFATLSGMLSVLSLLEARLAPRALFAVVALSGFLLCKAGQLFVDPGAFHVTWARLAGNRGRWDRVGQLSALGRFLKETSPPHAVIATSELGTINFHAEKDVVDLLGVLNPDVAFARLDPMRMNHTVHPPATHRRRAPQTLAKHRPEFIALYPMFTRTEGSDTDAAVAQLNAVVFRADHNEISYFRAGSFDSLKALGYVNLTVHFPASRWVVNYFVRGDALEDHVARLAATGARHVRSSSLSYSVSADIVRRFSPDGKKAP